CTQLSIYTVPFRSGRIHFFTLILLSWWDAARAVWLYWTGLIRFLLVGMGWLFGIARLFLKLMVEALRQVLVLPFSVTGRMTKSYFKPGVPWIAFLMLLFWCLMEALIFTYTLLPTVTEVLSDLVGTESSPYMGTILYLFLFMLIMGSFACIQALLEAVKKGEIKFLVQMIMVELFVMFFEVMFLYRELVDAITPWIAQQTGESFRMGIISTLTLATFGWIGIRGMTWFLFGQFGTPPLLAFISRRPLVQDGPAEQVAREEASPAWWKKPIEDFKGEIVWLHEKSNEFLEYLALPAMQVMAAALNFSLVLVASRPIFSIPFKNLREVMDTRNILAAMQLRLKPALEPKKVQS
ncbi:MAG TPA: hypothetical protein VNV63_04140, partial [Nitrospiria bacterium]|nr:hypothetical protein [Nitrospiria bacterium]